MELIPDLAKYGTAGVAIGSLVMIFLVIKVFLKHMKEMAERSDQHIQEAADKHEKAYSKLAIAIDRNTRSTDENLRFMKNLNGSLKKVVKEKQK